MIQIPANFSDMIRKTDGLRELYHDTSRLIAELDRMMSDVSDFGSMIEYMCLQEARCSCAIENIIVSEGVLLKAYHSEKKEFSTDVNEVLGCFTAMNKMYSGALSMDLIERICSTVKCRTMEIRSRSGEQVYLIDGRGEVVWIPPSGEQVPELLTSLFVYLQESKEDPLLKIIAFHAVFETIHPFMDGNGRTGRILIPILMQNLGLLKHSVLPFSIFILEHRNGYYRNLRLVQSSDNWGRWMYYMLQIIRESAKYMIKEIREE